MVCCLTSKQPNRKPPYFSNSDVQLRKWMNPCVDYLNPEKFNNTRRNRNVEKSFVSFIDKLHYELCEAANRSGCVVPDRATAWYQKQKENRAAKLGLTKDTKTEPECRVNTFVAKNKDDRSYISPELKRHINEHDERARKKQHSYLKATGLLRRSHKPAKGGAGDSDSDAYKPACTCGEIIARESLQEIDPDTNCFCWAKQKWTDYTDEPSEECVCATDVKNARHCKHCEMRLRHKLGTDNATMDEYDYNNEEYYNEYDYNEEQPYNGQPIPYWVGTVGDVTAFKRQTGGENKNIIIKRHDPKSCQKIIKETTKKSQKKKSKPAKSSKKLLNKVPEKESKKVKENNI